MNLNSSCTLLCIICLAFYVDETTSPRYDESDEHMDIRPSIRLSLVGNFFRPGSAWTWLLRSFESRPSSRANTIRSEPQPQPEDEEDKEYITTIMVLGNEKKSLIHRDIYYPGAVRTVVPLVESYQEELGRPWLFHSLESRPSRADTLRSDSQSEDDEGEEGEVHPIALYQAPMPWAVHHYQLSRQRAAVFDEACYDIKRVQLTRERARKRLLDDERAKKAKAGAGNASARAGLFGMVRFIINKFKKGVTKSVKPSLSSSPSENADQAKDARKMERNWKEWETLPGVERGPDGNVRLRCVWIRSENREGNTNSDARAKEEGDASAGNFSEDTNQAEGARGIARNWREWETLPGVERGADGNVRRRCVWI